MGLEPLVGVEGRPVGERRPHKRHSLVVATTMVVSIGEDLSQANVGAFRIYDYAPLRPRQSLIVPADLPVEPAISTKR